MPPPPSSRTAIWPPRWRSRNSCAAAPTGAASTTIVGVVPGEFRGTGPVMQYDFWVPVTMAAVLGELPDSTFRERGERGMLDAMCRLRAGVPISLARAEAMSMAAGLAAANPKSNRGVGATIVPTWEGHNGVNELLRAPLTILLAVSFVVLLIVCANVANLRSEEHTSELQSLMQLV